MSDKSYMTTNILTTVPRGLNRVTWIVPLCGTLYPFLPRLMWPRRKMMFRNRISTKCFIKIGTDFVMYYVLYLDMGMRYLENYHSTYCRRTQLLELFYVWDEMILRLQFQHWSLQPLILALTFHSKRTLRMFPEGYLPLYCKNVNYE